MDTKYSLSVVTAVQHAQANMEAILRNLDVAGFPDVEFLFCYTDADPDVPQLLDGCANCRAIRGADGSLIPLLWRDGIQAARADRIGLGTAHCIPEPGYVRRLLATDLAGTPGVGGVISNDPASGGRDWAIYLLRYISYSPPGKRGEVREIAADNALYRREDILKHADLLEAGFWEPSFHARFRGDGMHLQMEPELKVVHRNLYTVGQFFMQRMLHGREFGLARAREMPGMKRLLLVVLSPVLPAVFLAKIVKTTIRHGGYNMRLLQALPWLLVFLLAWGLGEAQGYIGSGRQTSHGNS